MNPITAQDPLARSLDVVTDNTQRLQQLFPEAFTEGKVDMDVLRELLERVDSCHLSQHMMQAKCTPAK